MNPFVGDARALHAGGLRLLVALGLLLATLLLWSFHAVVSDEVQRDHAQPPFARTLPQAEAACAALRDGHDDASCTPPVDALAVTPSLPS